MKKLNVILCSFFAFTFLLVISSQSVKAQLLDGVWFKLNASAKGYIVDDGTGDYQKKNFKITFYMHFNWNEVESVYDIDIWTKNALKMWEITSNQSEPTTNDMENFISDFGFTLTRTTGDSIQMYHTPFITIKTDNSGAFKNSNYFGIGEIHGGSFGSSEYYGWVKITGHSVSEAKLPFVTP